MSISEGACPPRLAQMMPNPIQPIALEGRGNHHMDPHWLLPYQVTLCFGCRGCICRAAAGICSPPVHRSERNAKDCTLHDITSCGKLENHVLSRDHELINISGGATRSKNKLPVQPAGGGVHMLLAFCIDRSHRLQLINKQFGKLFRKDFLSESGAWFVWEEVTSCCLCPSSMKSVINNQ